MKTIAKKMLGVMIALSSLVVIQAVSAQERSADAIALDELAKSGADMSKLYQVDFAVRFPSLEAANFAAAWLAELSFVIETQPSKAGKDWVLHGIKTMYLIEPEFRSLRDKLNAIAADGHGTYEGWRATPLK
jgi:hypothetical protein